MPTKANRPIVVLLTPTSASQVPNVAEVNNKGSPEKKPIGKKNMGETIKQLVYLKIKK